jgi:hypothetical protein
MTLHKVMVICLLKNLCIDHQVQGITAFREY